jgi:hypothetical protein
MAVFQGSTLVCTTFYREGSPGPNASIFEKDPLLWQ